jgi:N-acetylmuramoyl-L-alanine amidase
VGPTGVPEKALNLSLALLLAEALRTKGIQCALTRETDREVSLAERGEQTEALNADLVISLHHNALPDGRDPLKARGASCYYYHPFSKTLAQSLQAALAEEIPNYGLFYDSLYMTRIPQCLAVLVEVGFMTHPEEYECLLETSFQEKIAKMLCHSIYQYCLNLRT